MKFFLKSKSGEKKYFFIIVLTFFAWSANAQITTADFKAGPQPTICFGDDVDAVVAYPNPFICQTTIILPDESENSELEVYDLSGKVVRHVLFFGNEVSLERGTLSGGIYYYQISSDYIGYKIARTGKLIVSPGNCNSQSDY